MAVKPREWQINQAVNLGLLANVILAAVKTAAGILGNSPALLADGINSTSDVAYYIVVAVFMRLAGKPADPEHPYGHRQLESIAALLVGAFVITTAIAIFWNSVNSVFDLLAGEGEFTGATIGALVISLITIVVKVGLSVYTRRVGEGTGSAAVIALAADHRNDVLSSLAAAFGIFLGRSGYPWVDPLAGALVAIVVLRTGIQIIRESSADLMDSIPGEELEQEIRGLIASVPGVKEIEEILAHRFGPYLTVNVTVGIDGTLSVATGDRIASQVEKTLYDNIGLLRRVYVHYHPIGTPTVESKAEQELESVAES